MTLSEHNKLVFQEKLIAQAVANQLITISGTIQFTYQNFSPSAVNSNDRLYKLNAMGSSGVAYQLSLAVGA